MKRFNAESYKSSLIPEKIPLVPNGIGLALRSSVTVAVGAFPRGSWGGSLYHSTKRKEKLFQCVLRQRTLGQSMPPQRPAIRASLNGLGARFMPRFSPEKFKLRHCRR